MPNGTSRFMTENGDHILHYMGTSTFSNFTVLPEIAVAKIREAAPFDKVCYIGCGVTTGIGAVIYTAKAEEGCRAIVFGLGGIGLNVIQGLRLAGADQIVGVDLNPGKKPMAEKFGMTHFVNPKEVEGDLVPYLVDLTGGGADYSYWRTERCCLGFGQRCVCPDRRHAGLGELSVGPGRCDNGLDQCGDGADRCISSSDQRRHRPITRQRGASRCDPSSARCGQRAGEGERLHPIPSSKGDHPSALSISTTQRSGSIACARAM